MEVLWPVSPSHPSIRTEGNSSGLLRPEMARFSHEMPEDTCGNLPRNAGDSLESAIAFVGGNARTTGEEPFRERQAAAIAQRDALVEWATACSLILDPRAWEDRSVIGGSEHDIWEEPGEYWKTTRDAGPSCLAATGSPLVPRLHRWNIWSAGETPICCWAIRSN